MDDIGINIDGGLEVLNVDEDGAEGGEEMGLTLLYGSSESLELEGATATAAQMRYSAKVE